MITVLILTLLISAVPAVIAEEKEQLIVEFGTAQYLCDDSAIQQGDITFLPIRDVFGAIGNTELTWAKDEAEDKIIIITPYGKFQLVIDFANETAMGLDKTYAMMNLNHTIYLPVNFFGDVFDCAVAWDGEENTLLIGKTMAQMQQEKANEEEANAGKVKTGALTTMVRVVNLPVYEPTVAARSLPPTVSSAVYYQEGMASWYSDKFHGRRTSSGEAYDKNALTAAHPTLPFGTVVRVTSQRTGQSVDVRINDRGPFVPGRVIDISRAAAAEIGMISQGVGAVTLEIVQ